MQAAHTDIIFTKWISVSLNKLAIIDHNSYTRRGYQHQIHIAFSCRVWWWNREREWSEVTIRQISKTWLKSKRTRTDACNKRKLFENPIWSLNIIAHWCAQCTRPMRFIWTYTMYYMDFSVHMHAYKHSRTRCICSMHKPQSVRYHIDLQMPIDKTLRTWIMCACACQFISQKRRRRGRIEIKC